MNRLETLLVQAATILAIAIPVAGLIALGYAIYSALVA